MTKDTINKHSCHNLPNNEVNIDDNLPELLSLNVNGSKVKNQLLYINLLYQRNNQQCLIIHIKEVQLFLTARQIRPHRHTEQ